MQRKTWHAEVEREYKTAFSRKAWQYHKGGVVNCNDFLDLDRLGKMERLGTQVKL